MSTVIEIAAIRPPAAGKKLATLVSENGQSFGIWPDKLGPIKVGGRYGIEFEELEFRGRPYRKITKMQPANGQAAGNRHAKPGTAPVPPADAELRFVSATLNAFIAAGKIGLDARELGQATQLLRLLWSHTFGGAHG